MHDPPGKNVLVFVFLASGVLFTLLGVPLARRKVPPNGSYGFRTPRTLENHQLWYDVNATTGKGFVISGIIIAVSSIALLGLPFLYYCAIEVALLIGSTGLTTFVGWYKHLRN
jgi:uncharacterized membrane protein